MPFCSRPSRFTRSVRALGFAGLTVAALASGLTGARAVTAGPPRISLSQETAVRSPGEWHTVSAVVNDASGQPVADDTMVTFAVSGTAAPVTVGEPAVGVALATGGTGGWIVRTDGTVSPFGTTPDISPPNPVNSPVIDLSATPSGAGYWITTADGHVLTAGDAISFGDLRNITLNGPIRAMTPTPSGHGYWMLGSDGGIFAFGDAGFYGSTGAMQLPKPVFGLMSTPSGRGYWLFASDGAIYQFGDAQDFGDTSAIKLNLPMVDAVPTPTGKGYWLVSSDGGIFSFGDAKFYGSAGAMKLSKPIVRIVSTPTGRGYVMAGADGQLYPFGDAPRGDSPNTYAVPTLGGRATFRFTSDASGDTTIGASIGSPATITATPVSVRWRAGSPHSLVVEVIPGHRQRVSLNAAILITVKDNVNRPVDDGTPVTFQAGGTGAEEPSAGTVTTTGGQARIDFTSRAAGHTDVTVSVSGLSTTAGFDWDPPFTTGDGNNGGDTNAGAGDAGPGNPPGAARPVKNGYWMLGAGGNGVRLR